jgi:Flp pilus assembly protein TadD
VQAALAVAAVVLGAIFLVTSGGPDLAPSQRAQQTSASSAAAQQLREETRRDLEQLLASQSAQLEANKEDLQALETVAVLNARLGRFAEAEVQLSKLAAARPGDAEVLRVLGEAQAAQQEWGAAEGSYRRAWEASGRASLDMLQGLAGEHPRTAFFRAALGRGW